MRCYMKNFIPSPSDVVSGLGNFIKGLGFNLSGKIDKSLIVLKTLEGNDKAIACLKADFITLYFNIDDTFEDEIFMALCFSVIDDLRKQSFVDEDVVQESVSVMAYTSGKASSLDRFLSSVITQTEGDIDEDELLFYDYKDDDPFGDGEKSLTGATYYEHEDSRNIYMSMVELFVAFRHINKHDWPSFKAFVETLLKSIDITAEFDMDKLSVAQTELMSAFCGRIMEYADDEIPKTLPMTCLNNEENAA
jgi:hypothetical protein